MRAAPGEDDLSRAFAEKLRQSPDFARWFLNQTKFARFAPSARLLHEEQVSRRPKVAPANWWRHWWRKIPELKQERETDVFVVFEDTKTRARFAFHIENKNEAKFSPGQAEAYGPRARWMANTERYLNYTDFQTVLLAPYHQRERNKIEAGFFDLYISYEAVAAFISEFGGGDTGEGKRSSATVPEHV